ncbi:basic juvenile hormone-suppressible protein 1-like [Pararge aegeria]|uniref:Jg10617 protein n=1 Tax=Pararge aegeria aegeria TaxID=348720 RepID=A0A8S4RD18_9NEOP|nr:basic juvenile hormone-suppressible protein 1-like [Pararge aegeria]CAH2233649.1 jg10617 [Pararge aegeria aegeria]
MKFLVIAAFLAAATASAIKDEHTVLIGKDMLVNVDIKTKEVLCMKLLNFILQPTVYEDIRDVARDWDLEVNMDKYLKIDVVKKFIDFYKMGFLPRGEVFVHTNEKQMDEAILVFRLMYFAKDFDTFIRTACFLRERINGGMFVYAFTTAVFHREDCRGIILPAPYEIYPYFFVDGHIINKAFMLKMTKAATDPVIFDYYGIKVTDKNLVVIDWRKGLRHTLSEHDRLNYFTEDIDVNTFFYYLHMNYPYWMSDDVYGLNKERRGEVTMYGYQQLLARYRLERLSHGMCDIKMIMWDKPLKTGYWPKIRLHTGEEMPVRRNYVSLINKDNLKYKLYVDDVERYIREGIMNGRVTRRDGTVITLKKAEDFENLARMLLGGLGIMNDDAKVIHVVHLFRKLVSYGNYNFDKYTYIPTALDMYSTCLRDPLFWRIMKRITENAVLFKKYLPKYTKDELDFPGVRVERLFTDKLVTFMDDYDIDITNALYLDNSEMMKKKSDYTYVARMHRLNNHPFKVTIEVMSEKAVDAVVRVFYGPKYDCMGRLLNFNDKRMDMVEIDSFIYKLDTGKNTIVRNSVEMHDVITDRPWTRRILDNTIENTGSVDRVVNSYWYKTRMGIPHRMLLPLGRYDGLPLQFFVIVTPVRTGLLLPTVDINIMKDRHTCRWSSCFDTMPLGFPFDRDIDTTHFVTNNMKWMDVFVYRKDLATSNTVKDIDTSDMVMKRDDMTYLDSDMLVRRSYRDVMMMSSDKMLRL